MASTRQVLLVSQLLVLLAALANASHFYGGSNTFTTRENPDGTFTAVIRQRVAFDGSSHKQPRWRCFRGECGQPDVVEKGMLDSGTNGPSRGGGWTESQTILSTTVQSNKPFQIRDGSCCYVKPRVQWSLLTEVDLGIRSDTGKPNNSPDVTIIPFLRVPVNCPRTYKLLAIDPDGDSVSCRHGNVSGEECAGCVPRPNFQMDEGSCTMHYANSSRTGLRVFELVVEDFPTRTIGLSYTDGTQSIRYPRHPGRHRRSVIASISLVQSTSIVLPSWMQNSTTAGAQTIPPGPMVTIPLTPSGSQTIPPGLLTMTNPLRPGTQTIPPGLLTMTNPLRPGTQTIPPGLLTMTNPLRPGTQTIPPGPMVTIPLTPSGSQTIPPGLLTMTNPLRPGTQTIPPGLLTMTNPLRPGTQTIPPGPMMTNPLVPSQTQGPMMNTPLFPSETQGPLMNTPLFPSETQVPMMNTPLFPSETQVPMMNTPLFPSETQVPMMNTPLFPSETQGPMMNTPLFPSETQGPMMNTPLFPSETQGPMMNTPLFPSETQGPMMNTPLFPSETQGPMMNTQLFPIETQGPMMNTPLFPSETQGPMMNTPLLPSVTQGPMVSIPLLPSVTQGPMVTIPLSPTRTQSIPPGPMMTTIPSGPPPPPIANHTAPPPPIGNQTFAPGPMMTPPQNSPASTMHRRTTTSPATPPIPPPWWVFTPTPRPSKTTTQVTITPRTTTPPGPPPWWVFTPTPRPSKTTTQVTITMAGPTYPPPTSRSPLSRIPLHFTLQVDPPAPSCQEGEYLPRFLHPTPRDGERLHGEVNKESEITVKAQATHSKIYDMIFSGPLNVTKRRTTRDEFVIRWTPVPEDLGKQFPFCFIVEAQGKPISNGPVMIYQSELRCVLVEVGRRGVKANVICNETTMTVEVDKVSFEGLASHNLRLNEQSDVSCSLDKQHNATHIIAVIPLNGCGTQIEEDDDNLIFKNAIITVDDVNNIITRKHRLQAEFYCQYPKRSNVTLSFTAHRSNVTVKEKGFGIFTYQFEFFHSASFAQMIDPRSYPLEYDVGDKIYLEIVASSTVNNTELFVESCRAAPYDNPSYTPTYPIIENGCNVDPTVEILSPKHGKEFKLSMEAFKFIGMHDQVYISCSVLLCEAGNSNTRCSQGCIGGGKSPKTPTTLTRRKKRDTSDIQTTTHYISQGPLRLRRAAESPATGGLNLNLNLVFIAGCLLASVGMICAVVIYKDRVLSRATYERLPSTGN